LNRTFPGVPADLLASGAVPLAARADRPVSWFEFWPGWLFYLPVVMQWIALGLRHGDFSLPTAANPAIEAGGLCGESKTSILDQMKGPARDLLAPYCCFLTGAESGGDLGAEEAAMAAAGLAFPVVAKPDVGCNGTGVRVIRDRAGLASYLAAFPRQAGVVLQALVEHPGEAGIFYIREPGQARGRITSITLKSVPSVVGDGRSTLRALILADPRLGRMTHLFFPRLADRLDDVPDSGRVVQLTFVGNHCKGSTFRDGREHATAELNNCIERLARALPSFHFGRFDLRFRSLAELRRGTGFTIIEINGVGSEATHIWDPRMRLSQAYATQFEHYRAAFEIGALNRRAGHRSTGLRELFRLWQLQRRLMASYPLHD
jgi:hypothetical protein